VWSAGGYRRWIISGNVYYLTFTRLTNNCLSRINGWIYVGPFVCKSITIVCFVFFFLFYSPIVKAKYSRLLYWHALYLGQVENQYLSLARSFNEHIVAFHLIKTYALIIERSNKNVIGLVLGHGAPRWTALHVKRSTLSSSINRFSCTSKVPIRQNYTENA
jgi:hypothetical protein